MNKESKKNQGMSQDTSRDMSQDMSVEEILKSIRGIIDDRDDVDDDILELTNVVSEPSEYITKSPGSSENLVSEKSTVEASNMLQQFAKVAKVAHESTKDTIKNRTLEDLVVEMMRPQISKWLDDNLPSLVKNLIEKEIKKLVPDDTK